MWSKSLRVQIAACSSGPRIIRQYETAFGETNGLLDRANIRLVIAHALRTE